MKRLVLTAIAATACWCLLEQRAQAQFGYVRPQTSPFYRPPVSPYLNILRGGPLGPATGYYTLTRPQFEAFGQLGQLQTDLQSVQAAQQAALLPGGALAGLPGAGIPGAGLPGAGLPTTGLTTGHPVRFFSLSPYYGGFGGAGAGGSTFGRPQGR